jgi:hypothetical protein
MREVLTIDAEEARRVAAVLREIVPGGPVDLLPDEVAAIDRAIELLDPPYSGEKP